MSDKAQQAADFIVSHCPNVGAFHGSGEPYLFLQETAENMRTAKPSTILPARYIEHVAYAINIVGSNGFLTPPAAVASVYLATRFEYYFRLLSGKLNGDGTWVSQSARDATVAAIADPRLKKRRISSVALAYEIMKTGASSVGPYCASLDRILYASPISAAGNSTIEHIGDRIEFGRLAAGHGHWGDISAEAVFYGLMTAIVFYAQDPC
jgi:hypothetical protein